MRKGVALILLVFLMLMCSLVSLVAFSLLAQSIESNLSFVQSIQAQALAIAGKEWYLEKLENTANWSGEVDQTGIALGRGTFDIDIDETTLTDTNISFTITGKIEESPSGYTIQRKVTLAAVKYLKAFLFAVFWGRDTGSDLRLIRSTINGNFWSRGTTDVQRGSSINDGIAYCPNEIQYDITGDGVFTKQKINLPYPDMPQIDQSYYDKLMESFDSYIDSHGTGQNRNQTTDLVLNGDIIGCKNFNTSNSITISGHGYIVARNNINLRSQRASSGTLTISPSGGNIYFLAGRSLNVNSTRADTNTIINAGANLYSRAGTNTRQRLLIQKHSSTTTSIDSAFIIARRRIDVQDGSQVTNSTLYVSDVSDTNNYLRIRDSDTMVSGNIISVSGRAPGLIINNYASASGLIYHWGDNSGDTTLDDAIISGSVVASQYNSNRIRDTVVNYDLTSLPVTLPEGFGWEVVVESESWDDE